jgi:putative SOS response-associated peptidase YedK
MITSAPNSFMKPIHHRMPSVLRETDFAAWLDPDSSPEVLQKLIAPREWENVEAVGIEKLTPDKPDPEPPLFRDQIETASQSNSHSPRKGRGTSRRQKG